LAILNQFYLFVSSKLLESSLTYAYTKSLKVPTLAALSDAVLGIFSVVVCAYIQAPNTHGLGREGVTLPVRKRSEPFWFRPTLWCIAPIRSVVVHTTLKTVRYLL